MDSADSATDEAYAQHMQLTARLKQREDAYLDACKRYQCQIDPGTIVTIRNELECYQPSIKLTDNDLLAVCATFADLRHIRSLNLRRSDLSCNGAYLLCGLLRANKHIENIDLSYNRIADLGAQALSEMLQIDGSALTTLIVHRNDISYHGALHLAQGLRLNSVLQQLDISHNRLGSLGARVIRTALMERSMLNTPNQLTLGAPGDIDAFQLCDDDVDAPQTDDALKSPKSHKSQNARTYASQSPPRADSDSSESPCHNHDHAHSPAAAASSSSTLVRSRSTGAIRSPYEPDKLLFETWISPSQLEYLQQQLGLFIKFDGNFMKEEVFNSVTHGLGLILAVVASAVLMHVAGHYSLLCRVACGIFSFTLFFMYAASTLYHSFNAVPCARHVFHVLDFSAIFMLIAGTYTPILLIGFSHSPFHSLILFVVMWSVAVVGVGYSSYADPHDAKWRKLTMLYLAMSYAGVICAKPFVETFETMAWVLILGGGAWYTAGVWFISNEVIVPIYHTIWHICVIFGSGCHFFCILWYIVPMDVVERPAVDLTFAHVVDSIFFAMPISSLFTADNATMMEL